MTFLSGFPESIDWILLIGFPLFLMLIPALFLIVFFVENKQLRKRNKQLTEEKQLLLAQLQEGK